MVKNNNQSYNNQKNEYGNNNYQNQQYQDMNYTGQYNNGDYANQYAHNSNNYNDSYSSQNTNYNNIENNNYNGYNNNSQYNQENFPPNFNYGEYDKPKKKTGLIFLISFLVIGLIAITAYFGYTKYVLDKKAIVNLNQYEIDFKPYGTDGDGTASADIKKIPSVDTEDATVTKFLQEPTITYSKSNNLKNGEKVEVTISLSKSSAEAKKLELKNEISDIKKDYKLQDKKLDALNKMNSNFFNEVNNIMKQFEKQEKLLKANKESLANVIQAQTYLDMENSKRMTDLNDVIRKQNNHICILQYSIFVMVILISIVFILELIKWLV